MQEEGIVPSKTFWGTLFKRVLSIIEIVRRVLLWLCVVIFILFEWHFIPMELVTHDGPARKIILSALIVLGAGIIELLFDTRESVEKVSNDVKQLGENASTSLQSLEACMGNISNALDGLSAKDKILVKHLGLNMEHAWDYLKMYFLEHRNVNNIEVRLLILPNNANEILMHPNHPIPGDVAAWCTSVESRIKNIIIYLNSQKPQIDRPGKNIKIEIKQYRLLPTFHGLSVSGSFNTCCLSICRYKRNKYWEYDWGQFSYHTIREDTADSGVVDLKNIFIGHFDYLWETSGDPVVKFSTYQ